MNNVLLKPVISEKSLKLVEEHNEYTFLTIRVAGKHEIREVVKSLFGVKPLKIRTKIVRGKVKKVGKKKTQVRASDLKQVLVKLGAKDKIELFDIQKKAKGKKKK